MMSEYPAILNTLLVKKYTKKRTANHGPAKIFDLKITNKFSQSMICFFYVCNPVSFGCAQHKPKLSKMITLNFESKIMSRMK